MHLLFWRQRLAKEQPWLGESSGVVRVQAGGLCSVAALSQLCFLSLICFLWRSLDSTLFLFCSRQLSKQFCLASLRHSLDSTTPADHSLVYYLRFPSDDPKNQHPVTPAP